jgi:hypothetical protein
LLFPFYASITWQLLYLNKPWQTAKRTPANNELKKATFKGVSTTSETISCSYIAQC